MLSLSDLVTVKLPQSFSCLKLPIAYQFSYRAIVKTAMHGKSVKATSHSTIFDIPMRPVREDQRYRRRFIL